MQQTAISTGPRPWRTELAATLQLSWPLALANLLQMLTYAIDVIFIARLGDEQLAASSLAVALFGLVMWALSGLTGAVAPLIAEHIGAKVRSPRPIRRATRMAMWLSVISGALGMGLCLLLGPLNRITGQEPEIARMADEYMRVVMWSMIPMVLANVLRNYVSALGRPIFATAITAGGIGVNALANYAFIFGNFGAPELGLMGAGIATIITSLVIVAAYIVAIWLDPRLHRYRIFVRFWRPDWKPFWKIVRIGTPIALTISAEAGIFGAAAFMMGNFGAAALAGHTVALQIGALAFQIPFGIGQAATIRVGYFYGARDREGIARAGWTALGIAVLFMSSTATAMLVIPEALLSIYIDPDAPRNAALVGFALTYITVAAAFQLVDGVQAVAAGALRGLQDTRIPMWIAIFAYWVPGIGTSLFLGFGTDLDGTGVWIGLATGLAVAAALLTWRWSRRDRLILTGRGAPSA
ncbi:MATE family efflux transporter [Qipengyuania atrilutea]|uniref:Multidrug-efflux transporter n=1 Tax=Qipengyuania atrilutea TaxID=2744473 RepID=A0A850GYP0_9SPHN|nr:MATE family efflux transporter [Actirhodobacter atriluteus]NVD44721.1 MATE family efflux transporter [Actirhodobacter atriluteus]